MANRGFNSGTYHLFHNPVELVGQIAYGPSGAMSLSGKGFGSVSSSGTGLHYVSLTDQYAGISHVDFSWESSVASGVQFHSMDRRAAATSSPGFHFVSTNSDGIKVVTPTNGTVTFKLWCKNSVID